MKTLSHRTTATTTLAAVVSIALAACATTPQTNAMLEQARVDVSRAQANPQVAGEAKVDLATAEQALGRGDALLNARKSPELVNHEAYLAECFALAAQKGADLATSQKAIADAKNRRNEVLLGAREDEAARATRLAQMKSRELELSAQQTAEAQQQTAEAQQHSRDLEAALADLQGKQTDRGLVITLGDVLFATGRADLKFGSRHRLDKLVTFLQAYPNRNLRIEGFTDSVGGDDYNQVLSERRADSVRDALTGMGIASDRILTKGLGKSSPVADNDTATGRQQNRRVEVVVLEEGAPRNATR
jgi:outer membrane protein OmpA-like peptidoglycan-associated protein